jgi:hypothetical protein
MASYKTTLDRMRNTREIANRLNLGACPQCDYLRAVVIELISDLIGDDVRHPSLELSGAQHPAPSMSHAAPALPPQAAQPARAAQPATPAPPMRAALGQQPNQPAPTYARTLEEAKRLADERAAAAAKPASTAPLSQSVPIGRIVPMQKTAAELAAEHPAAAQQAAPDPTVPDPAGESFLGDLATDMDAEAEDLGAG